LAAARAVPVVVPAVRGAVPAAAAAAVAKAPIRKARSGFYLSSNFIRSY
jgi:hypothetical protein